MAQRKFMIDGGFETSDNSVIDGDLQIVGNLMMGSTVINFAAWSELTVSATVDSNTKHVINTATGAITMTMPAGPVFGDEVRIIDGDGNASTNNITINGNGNNIQGDATDLVIETDRAAFSLVYYNAANGWLLMEI